MAKFDDIVKSLVKYKTDKLEKKWEVLKEQKFKIKPVNLLEKYEKEKKETKVKTGTMIDEVLGGGLEPASDMLLFGEYGSGKSQTCFTMAVLCPDVVVYIDAEGSFRVERIVQICEARGLDWEKILGEKIVLFQPNNWIEQMLILRQIPSPADVGKIGLIVLDSLTVEFRGVEFSGRQSLTLKQPLVRETIFSLKSIVKSYGAALIYTTQIYEDPNKNLFLPDWCGQKPVGGASVLHQAAYVVQLRKGSGNVRIARMLDSSSQPLRERPFRITIKGIEDLPRTKKAEKVVERTEEYERKLAESMRDPKKKKEKKNGEEPTE